MSEFKPKSNLRHKTSSYKSEKGFDEELSPKPNFNSLMANLNEFNYFRFIGKVVGVPRMTRYRMKKGVCNRCDFMLGVMKNKRTMYVPITCSWRKEYEIRNKLHVNDFIAVYGKVYTRMYKDKFQCFFMAKQIKMLQAIERPEYRIINRVDKLRNLVSYYNLDQFQSDFMEVEDEDFEHDEEDELIGIDELGVEQDEKEN